MTDISIDFNDFDAAGWTRQVDGLTPLLQLGDTYVIVGRYAHQTWWEWLLRRPRRLQRFVVTSET